MFYFYALFSMPFRNRAIEMYFISMGRYREEIHVYCHVESITAIVLLSQYSSLSPFITFYPKLHKAVTYIYDAG